LHPGTILASSALHQRQQISASRTIALTGLAVIQGVQTAALLTVAAAVIYTVLLFRSELRGAASTLREVVSNQTELDRNVRRAWERIDAVEARLTHLERPGPPAPSP
jgi:hypothetical protein